MNKIEVLKKMKKQVVVQLKGETSLCIIDPSKDGNLQYGIRQNGSHSTGNYEDSIFEAFQEDDSGNLVCDLSLSELERYKKTL